MVKVSDLKQVTGIQNIDTIVDLLEDSNRYKVTKNVVSGYVVEGDLNEIAQYLSQEKAKYEARKQEEKERAVAEQKNAVVEQKRISKEAASVLITSGYSFEGFSIVKYSGYISGDDCVTMPRDSFFGHNKVEENLCGALVKIRRQALKELKEAAVALNCNAVIGVDFDYLVMDPQHGALFNNQGTIYEPYVICVTANGTAVKIERNTGIGVLNKGTNPASDAYSNGMMHSIEETIQKSEPKAVVVDNVLVCQGCDFVMDNPDPEMKFCPQCGSEIVKQ